jgi:hypothetical protein
VQNKNKKTVQLSKIIKKIPFYYGKSKIHSFVLALFAVILLLKVLIGGALFLFPKASKAQTPLPLTAETLVFLTNEERLRNDRPALSINEKLTIAATKKASDVLANDYFAHTTPNGKQFFKWIQEENYQYRSAGENLAIAFTEPSSVIHAWMMSKTHKENLLDPYYSEIGIAVMEGEFEGDTTTIIVQLFGEPLTSTSLKSKPSPPPVAGERTISPYQSFEQTRTPYQGIRDIFMVFNTILTIILAILTCGIIVHFAIIRRADALSFQRGFLRPSLLK